MSPKKKEMRDRCWKGITWQYKFVHGKVHDESELSFIEAHGVELINFADVLRELCGHKPGELFGGAGTDIAEMIRYYAEASAALPRAKLIAHTKLLAFLKPAGSTGPIELKSGPRPPS
jgi:hypothetical protein